MNIDSHLSTSYPKKLVPFRGNQIIFPQNLGCESEAVQGGGCGFGRDIYCGALGEFLERNYFFTDVPIDAIGKIHEYNTKAIADELYLAINQLKRVNTDPSQYDFQLVRLRNVFTDEIAYFPRRLVSLGKISISEENFIPMMDSSGIAVHGTSADSFKTALNEFVERQALVGTWLSDRKVRQLDTKLLEELGDSKRFCEVLVQNGDVSIFDIGGMVPGRTVAICYLSKSKQDRVQYALGVASSQTLRGALISAAREIWQDYMYLYSYVLNDMSGELPMFYAGDTYHMSHMKDNYVGIKDKVEFYKRAKQDTSPVDLDAKVDVQDELAALREYSEHIYVYQAYDKHDDLHYTRLISPSFYLHMSIHENLNFNNAFARKINADVELKVHERIPFP